MDNSESSSVLNEIPDRLKSLSLCLVKVFYGTQHYVLFDFVQRNICVRDEQIREVLKIDNRLLRQLLVTLKVDKFIKERQIADDTEGRPRKYCYYHVNYKAILNVTKYKIDHMRQKIEVREQDTVRKASYVCVGCRRNYDALDIGKIYSESSQEMICWQCNSKVIADNTSGPTEETRSSLAKFNNEMAGIFSMLQVMDGIRFGRNILEPPINTSIDVNRADGLDSNRMLKAGEHMFSTADRSRSNLYANGITVSIGESQDIQVEAKPVIPWLQHNVRDESAPSSSFAHTNDSNLDSGIVEAAAAASMVATLNIKPYEHASTLTSTTTITTTVNGEEINSNQSSSLLDQMMGTGSSMDISQLLLDFEGATHGGGVNLPVAAAAELSETATAG